MMIAQESLMKAIKVVEAESSKNDLDITQGVLEKLINELSKGNPKMRREMLYSLYGE